MIKKECLAKKGRRKDQDLFAALLPAYRQAGSAHLREQKSAAADLQRRGGAKKKPLCGLAPLREFKRKTACRRRAGSVTL